MENQKADRIVAWIKAHTRPAGKPQEWQREIIRRIAGRGQSEAVVVPQGV